MLHYIKLQTTSYFHIFRTISDMYYASIGVTSRECPHQGIALIITMTWKLFMLYYTQVDLLKYYGSLPFNLDFFTDMMDLTPLLQ